MPTPTLLGLGVGVLVMLLLGFMLLGRTGVRANKKDKTAAKQAELTDPTPSAEWAYRAQERLDQGDKAGARKDYMKAAEAAEHEGNSKQAENYNMCAYQLLKFTPLNISNQH